MVEYRKAVKTVKKSVKNAKKNYEKNLAQNIKQNPKAFYGYINSKKSNRVEIGPLKCNDVIVDQDKDVANVLNNFFGSVFTTENTSELPKVDKLPFLYCLDDIEFSPYKVEQKLKNLKKHQTWP